MTRTPKTPRTKKNATPAEFTYQREAVPADRVGTCPCCLRADVRASGRAGAMQRHGWKETGRVVGQHGCGFQWGACHGSGMRPLEETDRSAIVVLGLLAIEIKNTRETIARHVKGDDVYRREIKFNAFSEARTRESAAKAQDALRAAGYEFTATESVESTRRRDLTINIMVEVPRDKTAIGGNYYDAATVPAWETLRASAEKHATDMLKALETQKTAIEAAIVHHRDNPSNGGKDQVKRGPALHLACALKRHDGSTMVRAACAAFGFSSSYRYMATTEDASKVTCTKCAKRAQATK